MLLIDISVSVVLTSNANHGQAAVVELLGLHLCESISIQVRGTAERIKA